MMPKTQVGPKGQQEGPCKREVGGGVRVGRRCDTGEGEKCENASGSPESFGEESETQGPPEAGKGKDMDSALALPEGISPSGILDFGPVE